MGEPGGRRLAGHTVDWKRLSSILIVETPHCGSDFALLSNEAEHIFMYLLAVYEVNFDEDHGLKTLPTFNGKKILIS